MFSSSVQPALERNGVQLGGHIGGVVTYAQLMFSFITSAFVRYLLKFLLHTSLSSSPAHCAMADVLQFQQVVGHSCHHPVHNG